MEIFLCFLPLNRTIRPGNIRCEPLLVFVQELHNFHSDQWHELRFLLGSEILIICLFHILETVSSVLLV